MIRIRARVFKKARLDWALACTLIIRQTLGKFSAYSNQQDHNISKYASEASGITSHTDKIRDLLYLFR